MKKNNFNPILGLVVLTCSLFAFFSCEEDLRKKDLTPTTLYFLNHGVNNIGMYNRGDGTSYSYTLKLCKSGALGGGASAVLDIMTAEELANYNEKNNTNYALLNPDTYLIEENEVSFLDDIKDVSRSVNVILYPDNMEATATNQVLAVTIRQATVNVNEERAACIIFPQLTTPVFKFKTPGQRTVLFRSNSGTVSEFDIEIVLTNIDQNDRDIELELEVAEDYVTEYNRENETAYQLLPQNYAFEETKKTLAAGETSLSFSLKLTEYQVDVDNTYMLPVRIKNSSMFDVDQENLFLVMIRTNPQKLSKTGWTIADCNTDDGNTATLIIDGLKSTYWESNWHVSPRPPLPHYVVIDMLKVQTIVQIGLLERDGYAKHAKAGEFYIGNDLTNWTKIGTYILAKNDDLQIFPMDIEGVGRYLKVCITESNQADGDTCLAEVEPYGY
jgi:hypothetical protein